MSTSDKMKTTASDLLAKSKTGFARLKQQVSCFAFPLIRQAMVKLGKAEETVDVPFAQEIQRQHQTHELLKKINKDTQEMLELVKKLDVLQNTIAQDIYELYDSQSELYNAALKYQDVCKQFDICRTQFETQMKADFLDPLSKYIGQFKEVKERIKEEDVRKVDMDRYGRELKTYQEKAKTAKATVYEQKYETAKLNYTNLRTELEQDMPALFNDRVVFFNPAFATLLTGLSEYYRGCAKSMSEVLPIVGHINRQSIHDHPRVITPPEQSSATHKATAATGTVGGHTSPVLSQHSTSSSQSASEAKPVPVPPSKPPVQAPKVARAQALFDFNAQEANELPFKTGDVITILSQKGEWWEGELNGRKGLLPSNYVKLM